MAYVPTAMTKPSIARRAFRISASGVKPNFIVTSMNELGYYTIYMALCEGVLKTSLPFEPVVGLVVSVGSVELPHWVGDYPGMDHS